MAREATHGAGVPRRHRTGSRRVEGTGSGGGLRKLLPPPENGLSSSADAELVRSQGAFVNADRVIPAQ